MMALSDPELEMLEELLEDDPGAEKFLIVGQEYVSRKMWSQAVRVLAAGVGKAPEELGGWALLATAAMEDGQYSRSIEAIEKLSADAQAQPDVARLKVLALAGSGDMDAAKAAASEYLKRHPADDDVQEVLDRVDAPAQSGSNRATDPFVNSERAEQYVIMGRPDRAVRVYRRILFHNPGNNQVASRLRQLMHEPVNMEDDLSEEIDLSQLDTVDPSAKPPDLQMPEPSARAFGVASEQDDDGVPDLDLPDMGLSLAETLVPDSEIASLDLSKGELLSVIQEQKQMSDITAPPAPERVAGPPAPEVAPVASKLQSLDLSKGPIEDVDDDFTDPGIDPASESVTITDAPTNVVAKGADLTQLARKVKKVKRRRSLFRR